MCDFAADAAAAEQLIGWPHFECGAGAPAQCQGLFLSDA